MHDPRVLLDPGTDAVRKLARRGYQLDLGRLQKLFSQRNTVINEVDRARGESKRIAQEVQATAKRGESTSDLIECARVLKAEISEGERRINQYEEELQVFLLGIPNLPADRCPDGDSEDFAIEIRTRGNPPTFDFDPLDHVDIGERLGIFDFGRATKLSGPRFAVVKGVGAQLERSVAQLFLDLHTGRHGYTEFSLPALVTRATMTGTGQLPKFQEDLFRTGSPTGNCSSSPPLRFR